MAASREPSEFAPPSVSPRGRRDDVYIFQDIGNILRDVARLVRSVQIDINMAYAWLRENPVSSRRSNWRLKITFLSCSNFRMTILCAIALMYTCASYSSASILALIQHVWYTEFWQSCNYRRILSNFSRARTVYIILLSSKKLDLRGKQMILKCTWQDFELKEPSRIENNVLENSLENSRYPIFLPLEQPLLALSRNICISGDPFRISETDANRKGFSWMRENGRSRVFARLHPFLNSFYSTPVYDASVSLTISRRFRFQIQPVIRYSHCAFAFVGNASCGIERKRTFVRDWKECCVLQDENICTKHAVYDNDKLYYLRRESFFPFPAITHYDIIFRRLRCTGN